jgi:CelD/BcsL family acetyltransferase involved in cellulose biosynthesis
MESLEWVTDPRRFAVLAADWDRMAEKERAPFLMSSWIEAWCAAFGGSRRPLIAALWRDGALVAGLPLLAGWRSYAAPTNDHTPEFGLLAVDSEARAHIVAGVLAKSDALIVPALAAGSLGLTTLLQAARETRRWSLVEGTSTSLITETSGSVEQYRGTLSSKVRSEAGRLRRLTEREHELRLTPLACPSNLDGQLTEAFALEASGWKGRAGTAIICSPDTEQFYRQIARRFHAAGALRLSELRLDGRLAAMAFSIIHQERAFTLKVAYDERHRRLGPGFVLLIAMIERCFELGLDAYEFSGPEAEYERRFATSERTYRRLRIYQPGPINAVRYLYHGRARSMLRRAYRAAGRPGKPPVRHVSA